MTYAFYYNEKRQGFSMECLTENQKEHIQNNTRISLYDYTPFKNIPKHIKHCSNVVIIKRQNLFLYEHSNTEHQKGIIIALNAYAHPFKPIQDFDPFQYPECFI